jgi:hypothetical protein
MKEILDSIQNRLDTVEGLNYVSEDWGQLEEYGRDIPAKFPLCLVDVQAATYSDIGQDRTASPQNRQEGVIRFTLKFADLRLGNANQKAPQVQKDSAWRIHEIIDKAHVKLHGFRPVPEHGALMRRDRRKFKRGDGVLHHELTYEMALHNV